MGEWAQLISSLGVPIVAMIGLAWYNANMGEWAQLISSLGVPIVAMIGLAWYIVKRDKESRERDGELEAMLEKIVQEHRAEVSELREVVSNNTLILTHIYERMGGSLE